jgi:hypothetical protein
LASVVEMTDPSSNQQVRPMTADEAERVATWRFSGDWSIYDLGSAQPLIDDLASYHCHGRRDANWALLHWRGGPSPRHD